MIALDKNLLAFGEGRLVILKFHSLCFSELNQRSIVLR